MAATGRILRVFSNYSSGLAVRSGCVNLATARILSDNVPIIQKKVENESRHINCASLERGVTKYYCNRNPRSLELMGMADKPRGFATKNQRMDYYHRYPVLIKCYHIYTTRKLHKYFFYFCMHNLLYLVSTLGMNAISPGLTVHQSAIF